MNAAGGAGRPARRGWRLPRGSARRSLGPASAALACALAVAGCTGGGAGSASGPGRTRPAWQEVRLPPGPGRPSVRALATCGGRWYAVGAYAGADGSARPAAWASPDATTWTALAVQPEYPYGPTQTLTAAACRGGSLVALGGVSGGVHGNLRISSWLATGGGPLVERPAGLDLYGGEEQIDTSRAVAGPRGFLLVGDRAPRAAGPGAAVWVSPGGAEFRLVDRDPALGWSPARSTAAGGAVALPGGDWLVVGSLSRPGHLAQRAAAAWRSADGLRWRQITPAPSGGPGGPPSGGPVDEAFQQVAVVGDRTAAVGTSGDGFAAWWAPAADPGAWHPAGRITPFAGTRLPEVATLATTGDGGLLAALDDGGSYGLWQAFPGRWAASGGWRPVAVPAGVPSGPGHRMLVAASGRRVLLVAGDDPATRLWTADLG